MYSLSARSNVPFVRLIGKTVDKTFTWGEIVEVPQGELCSISNASWHGGDIYINGGCDYDNRPARITVPVPYSLLEVDPGEFNWFPAYPADVRTAKRAYLMLDATSNAVATSFWVVQGKRFDGSHNTANQLTAANTGTGYEDFRTLAALSQFGLIPMGHGAPPGDDSRPHVLLTTAIVTFQDNIVIVNTPNPGLANAYYTMEYY